MNSDEVCTQEQAIALAGVSARTLQRFCESGYLTATETSDGSVTYLKSQILEIFGGAEADTTLESEVAPPTAEASCSSPAMNRQCEVTSACSESSASEMPSSAEPSGLATTHSPESHNTSDSIELGTSTVHTSRVELEVERLKNLLSIQERMLDAKDDEIADLKNQRAWLRQRVEKLEEKSDRDQILLLSETQTIRSLLAYQESKKSAFRQLLEWVGIAQPSGVAALPPAKSGSSQSSSSSSGRTIEVRQAANNE